MDLGTIITISLTILLILVGIMIWIKGGKNGTSGTIVVIKDEEKIIYTLELDEDPENLQYKDKVVFRVKHEIVEDPTQNKHGV